MSAMRLAAIMVGSAGAGGILVGVAVLSGRGGDGPGDTAGDSTSRAPVGLVGAHEPAAQRPASAAAADAPLEIPDLPAREVDALERFVAGSSPTGSSPTDPSAPRPQAQTPGGPAGEDAVLVEMLDRLAGAAAESTPGPGSTGLSTSELGSSGLGSSVAGDPARAGGLERPSATQSTTTPPPHDTRTPAQRLADSIERLRGFMESVQETRGSLEQLTPQTPIQTKAQEFQQFAESMRAIEKESISLHERLLGLLKGAQPVSAPGPGPSPGPNPDGSTPTPEGVVPAPDSSTPAPTPAPSPPKPNGR